VEDEVAATVDVTAYVEAEDDKATTVDFDEAHDRAAAGDFDEVDEALTSHEHAALLVSFKTAPRSASKRVGPSSRR
jgi:hypothetical protein